MTSSTLEVAVCCSSDSLSSRVRCCSASNSRTFSMAITAWSAKVFDQLDLVIRERFDFSLQNGDGPQKRLFTEHRNCHRGAVALLFDQIGKFIIRHLQYISDMNRASFLCRLACD